jgi:hypothetical protein
LGSKQDKGAAGRCYCNVAAIFRPKTKAEEAEEKRVAAVTARVKQATAQVAETISASGCQDQWFREEAGSLDPTIQPREATKFCDPEPIRQRISYYLNRKRQHEW